MITEKRKDVISWKEYFMGMAILSAKRSKDPSRQVGCCIVDDNNHIISVGYNGFPNGCSDDEFPWRKDHILPEYNKYFYVVHAEANAILNSSCSVRGCTLYVTYFPCNECAKFIIQSGIKKIVYLTEPKNKKDSSYLAAKLMLNAAKVKYKKFNENIEVKVVKE